MKKNSIMDRTTSMILVGLTCYAVASANTSADVRILDTTNRAAYQVANDYGNNSYYLREYRIPENKFNVEKEAKELFGNMREATLDEQKGIQDNIDKIAIPTGINFWDYA